MKRTLAGGAAVLLATGFVISLSRPDGPAKLAPDPGFAAAPLHFIANNGQAAPDALFQARLPEGSLWLTRKGLVFEATAGADSPQSMASVMTVVFQNARADAAVRAVEPSGYRVSYFFGRDESEWITDVPTSQAVLYEGLYDGVDLKVYGTGRAVEFDWIVRPGGDPGRVRFAVEGAPGIGLDPRGDLAAADGGSRWRIRRPEARQTIEGRTESISASFVKTGRHQFGVRVGRYDRRFDLVIDPLVTVFGTYLGGHGYDGPFALAVDAAGCPYIAGYTVSTDFPPAKVSMPRSDAFVSKLSADGSELIYTAFFPMMPFGTYDLVGLAVDGKGSAYLTGATKSRNFPVKNAFQPEMAGGGIDGFFLKLTPNGKGLVYSSFLGGGSYEYGSQAAVDSTGSLTVAGLTASRDFPVVRGVQKTLRGHADVFVAKFNPDGRSPVYSTYLGGSGSELPGALAVDASGAAYLTGTTTGRGFPVKNAFQNQVAGLGDAFITKLAPDGGRVIFSSFLGGTSDEFGQALAVDVAGAVYIAGYTMGKFPLRNAFQKTRRGSYEGFVSKIAPNGSGLEYSSYLGGRGYDLLEGIAVDELGTVFIAGTTDSADFPLKTPFQSAIQGRYDGVLVMIAPGGRKLVLSTYLGGRYEDGLGGIALDADGNVFVTGSTNSPDFPVRKPYQKTLAGDKDVVVLKFKRTSS